MSTAIPVSTVPAAIAAIAAAIQAQIAAAADTTTELFVGTPAQARPNTMIVVATDVRRVPEKAATVGSGGRNWIEEKYTVVVEVTVAKAVQAPTPVTGPLSVVDRAWQLVAYVESAVRSDPSLAGTVLEAYPARSSGGRPRVGAGASPGRVVNIPVFIHCSAVI